MAKHPVPKRKTSKKRSSQRYAKFQYEARKKLENHVSLTVCPECGQKKLTHHACPACGTYRGRNILDKGKDIDKITKIKA